MKLTSPLGSGGLSSFKFLLGLFFLLGAACNGRAVTPLATAQVSDTALGGGEFDYTIVLNNVGTGPVGTFWFSWIPGEDFMGTSPTDIVSPTNWTSNITHGGSTDGYAIQWVASSPLAAGSSLDFSFESTQTPSELAGDSPFYTTTPEATAFVYGGAPFSDAGDQFIVQSVPEPSTLDMLVVCMFGISCLGWRRFHSRFHS
jgi:hypothetical protein